MRNSRIAKFGLKVMDSRKLVTSTMETSKNEEVKIIRCSESAEKVEGTGNILSGEDNGGSSQTQKIRTLPVELSKSNIFITSYLTASSEQCGSIRSTFSDTMAIKNFI